MTGESKAEKQKSEIKVIHPVQKMEQKCLTGMHMQITGNNSLPKVSFILKQAQSINGCAYFALAKAQETQEYENLGDQEPNKHFKRIILPKGN